VAQGRPWDHVAEEEKAQQPSFILRVVLDSASHCHQKGEVPVPSHFPAAHFPSISCVRTSALPNLNGATTPAEKFSIGLHPSGLKGRKPS